MIVRAKNRLRFMSDISGSFNHCCTSSKKVNKLSNEAIAPLVEHATGNGESLICYNNIT